jgi:TonB-linked SusC/RagA family outer membrane protein
LKAKALLCKTQTHQMYKIYSKKLGVPLGYIHKILLVMRLTTFLLFAILMQVSATGLAQKISMSRTNMPLKSVLKELRLQSGYDFVYEEKLLELAKPVDINVTNGNIEDVLRSIFSKQPLTYTIQEKTVVITKKKIAPAEHPVKLVDNEVANVTPVPDHNSNAVIDIDVHGKVMDDAGNPLAGVTVSVKGTKRITSTNKDGEFLIKAENAADILIFTSIGMETLEVRLNNRTDVTITLKATSTVLGEVRINTGFQTLKNEQMTGAAVTITSAELEQRYTPNIINNLEGRVPGLVNYRGVTEIRGVSTINATRDVLYVVDGLPIDGSIANINPYDVESINVLKDAAATAIYGVRASNGVIVITTKKAKGHGTTVEFGNNVTITDKPDIGFNLLSPAQQVDLESSFFSSDFYKNGPGTVAATGTNISRGNAITPVQYAYYQLAQGQITQSQLDSRLAGFKQNDFRKQYTDNALLKDILQQYNLAIRTNTGSYNSSLVLNYKNDNTGIINAYNRQINIFYKGSYHVRKWLDADFGVNGIIGNSKESNSGFATDGTDVPSYLQLLDRSGKRMYYTTADYNMYNTTPTPNSMLVNHLDELGIDSRITKQYDTRYFVNFNAKIIPGLTFSPQFQYENGITNISAYSEQNSYTMRYLNNIYSTALPTTPVTYSSLLPSSGGKLATTNATHDSWTARAQLNYQKTFGKNAINVIGGTEFRQTHSKGTNGLLLGYDDQLQSQSTTSVNFPGLYTYSQTGANTFKSGFNPLNLYNTYLNNPISLVVDTVHRTNSGYANATYTYNSKYNAFGSYRVDYADVFGLDKKYRGRPLWSAGLSWNASNEDFMKQVTWVNFLKVRGTYGVTGNINLNATSFLTANSTLTNAATNLPVSVVTSAANPELTWERTETTNLGMDFALFNNRLTGSLDWYHRNTTNLFTTTRIDASEGFTSQIINNGGLVNNGIELGLNYTWLKSPTKGGLVWSSQLVVSHNNNKITYIDEVSVTPVQLVQGGYKAGDPVNALFSLQYKGLNSVGQPQWLKVDGTLTTVALTANDLSTVQFSGGTDPKNNIALTNTVYYKGFSLNVLAVYYGGQYMRAVVPDIYTGVPYASLPSYLAKSWTPANMNTLIPGFGQYAPSQYPGSGAVPANQLQYSNAWVRAGDFIKIRNIVLGYQLPQRYTDKLGAKNVRLTFQVNNPKALWTKNDVGVDPETVDPTTGIGGARVPTSYVLGINFNL